jgi:predicted ferric reductase
MEREHMIDHTLSWEVARVGGMLALVLSTASVVVGLALSLKLRSSWFPRFITNELHRYVSLLTLVFIAVHGLAVWLDPFTAFTTSEVLVPLVAHYRPLWVAMGVVAGYLMVAVYASEWIRSRIGYAWWRRFHSVSFAVFLLGILHGLGTGSDTASAWGIAVYVPCVGSVAMLLILRLLAQRASDGRDVAIVAIALAIFALAVFTSIGPMRSGWNDVANNGNGSGASATWLASQN